MKRSIMILLVSAMALTMFACGKEVTSSESSLSTVSMPESSSLYTNSAPPLPESSSAPSDTQVTPQKEYIEKLVPYIPEGVDLKEYIVGKWHMAYRDEYRYGDNVEERIYYYYYDFKPDIAGGKIQVVTTLGTDAVMDIHIDLFFLITKT